MSRFFSRAADKENVANGYSRTHAQSPSSKAFKPSQKADGLCWQGKCSGWLDMKKKNGIMSSSWSRVWCVIGKEGNMHVFSAPDAPHRILGLPLHATVVKDVVDLESKGKMDIALECPKKKISMRLRCLDKSIKNHWLKEIRKAVQMPNKASISQFEVQTRELESSSAGVAISKDLISFD